MGLCIWKLKEITLTMCKILKATIAFNDLRGFVFAYLIKFKSMFKKMIDCLNGVVLSRAVRSGVFLGHPEETG